jgi:CRP/FNR family cyclic AMP-dependent transcriptional regulator
VQRAKSGSAGCLAQVEDELARVLGLSRVTVNRALARLSQAGAVELTPYGILIADRTRLNTFAAD